MFTFDLESATNAFKDISSYFENSLSLLDLFKFLTANHGFRYVKTYEQLCQLAESLHNEYPEIVTPPCSPCMFALAIDLADPDGWGNIAPTRPANVTGVQVLAAKFHGSKTIDPFELPFNNRELYNFLVEKENRALHYIKTYEDLLQLAQELYDEYGYDAINNLNPPITPTMFALIIDKTDPAVWGNIAPTRPNLTNLEMAAAAFQLDNIIEDEADIQDINNDLLINFLQEEGFIYIKTYEQLCELAQELHNNYGYDAILTPPCTTEGFALAFSKMFSKYEQVEVKPTIPEDARLIFITDRFLRNMVKYEPSRECTPEQQRKINLLKFLQSEGYQYVRNHAEFCEFIEHLSKNKNYSINDLPSLLVYNLTINNVCQQTQVEVPPLFQLAVLANFQPELTTCDYRSLGDLLFLDSAILTEQNAGISKQTEVTVNRDSGEEEKEYNTTSRPRGP